MRHANFLFSEARRSSKVEARDLIGFRLSKLSKNNNKLLYSMTMNTSIESKMNDASPPASQESGSNAPSGFILKLFQMVNGAPDEVISVSRTDDDSCSSKAS